MINIFCSQIDHWFNSYHHSFFQFCTSSSFTIIRHLRIFMQMPAKAMTYQFSYHTIAMFSFCIILYGKSNITYPVTMHCFFNSFVQGFFCYP